MNHSHDTISTENAQLSLALVFTHSAVAADRCAREIVRFLTRFGGALAAAERQSVRSRSIVALPIRA